MILFDKLVYVDRLKHAGLADDQARAHADAMDVALCEAVATKWDITLMKNEVRADIAGLDNKIDILSHELVIKLGAIVVAAVAAGTTIGHFWAAAAPHVGGG